MLGVLVVEDSWVWGSAIAHQLSTRSGVRVVGPAGSVEEGLDLARTERPIVSLVDLKLGDDCGLRFVRTSQMRELGTRVVVVTSEPSAWALEEARDAGAAGFVAKDDLQTGDKVWAMVQTVARGGTYFSAPVASADDVCGGECDRIALSFGLTGQEVEMIRCFSRGMDTTSVARHLSIGHQTVRNKTHTIGPKLGVRGRLEIVSASLRLGIIKLPEYV